MRIGNVEITDNVILAPMAGVTDLPFRLLCKEMGCGMTVTEMVSAKAVLYKNRNTESLLCVEGGERPTALQLFGSEPEVMAEAARRLEERDFAIFDINMGCPVPKIVNNGEGSALMKNPRLAGKIVEAVVKAVKKPVTVKIRKGFDEAMVNAPQMAHVIESCGGAAVTIHGRTREQYYSGRADWDIIRRVKAAVSIPVIGNGDIFTGMDARRMIEQTGCDGVMIGRGARGNPWIFREAAVCLSGGEMPSRPSVQEVRGMILRHARMLEERKGAHTGIREMRKHFAWYTAGMPHSAAMRARMNEIETIEALEELARQL